MIKRQIVKSPAIIEIMPCVNCIAVIPVMPVTSPIKAPMIGCECI